MKQVYYKSLFLAILSLMSVKANAYDCKVDGIYYFLSWGDNEAYVTCETYDNESDVYISTYSGWLDIPSYIEVYNHNTYNYERYKVVGIGDHAFQNCTKLTGISIPNSVTKIGSYAFSGCSGLTSVMIPNSVTSIESSAFAGCGNLTSVSIPESVSSFGYHMFFECENLVKVTIDNNTLVANTTSNNDALNTYFGKQVEEYVLGSHVTHIGDYAFSHSESLRTVTIPNSVTSIGFSAFGYCYKLTSITIPNSVTEIGNSAFQFSGLTAISIPGSVRGIEGGTFWMCTSLTMVEISEGVTYIGGSAFSDCPNLTSISIPKSVTSIGGSAFSGCSGLTSMVVDGGNSVYDSRNNCNAIIETATNTLISGCKSTTIPNSVTSIGGSAFSGCSGLTSVTIPNSVTRIGDGAFYRSGLVSVTIPNSVTSIGYATFRDCRGLTSVTIGNGVTTIEENAFYNCRTLTSIDIPSSVTSIGYSAFSVCIGLSSVIVHWKQPIQLKMNSGGPFKDLNYSDVTLYVPVGTVDAYRQADGWNQFVNIVESSETRISMPNDLVTYYNTEEVLDFNQIGTEENGLKAYVATGFDGETVTLKEVKIVPTNTAVILMGKAKNTYTIPFYKSPEATKDAFKLPSLNESGEINYLRGVEESTTIYPTDGEKMNFVLADGDEGRRFYPVQKDGIKVYVGEAYLQLPASLCPEGISSLSLQFKDDDSSDIINLNVTNAFDNETIYNLCGQLISTPQPGVNILRMSDGSVKKVMMK